MKVGDIELRTAHAFGTNYREKSPVIAEVIEGNGYVNSGDILLCHHNTFYTPSPYWLHDDLFSIPFSPILFARVDRDGNLTPICGNILCDRIDIPSNFPLPPSQRKQYIDRIIVTNKGETKYNNGQTLFTRPHSYYEMVYVFNGKEKRVHKCNSEMVCGILIP